MEDDIIKPEESKEIVEEVFTKDWIKKKTTGTVKKTVTFTDYSGEEPEVKRLNIEITVFPATELPVLRALCTKKNVTLPNGTEVELPDEEELQTRIVAKALDIDIEDVEEMKDNHTYGFFEELIYVIYKTLQVLDPTTEEEVERLKNLEGKVK